MAGLSQQQHGRALTQTPPAGDEAAADRPRVGVIGPYALLRHRSLEIYQELLADALRGVDAVAVCDRTPVSPLFVRFVPGRLQRLNVAERLFLVPALQWLRPRVDIAHAISAESAFVLPTTRARAKICTFHDFDDFDFLPEENWWWRRARRYRRANNVVALREIDLAVTISHFTKARLQALFPDARQPVHVVHNPCRFADDIGGTGPSDAQRARARAHGRYIFHIGTIARKNRVRLLEAFARLRRHHGHDVRLVLCGVLRAEERAVLETLALGAHVDVISDIDDGQLQAYYAEASAFVFPSLYEGFGFPVIEAQCFATAVVAADIEILREVGGDACLFVPPTDAAAIAAGIDQVLSDPALRERLAIAGRANAARFTLAAWRSGYASAYAEALELARAAGR